MNNSKHYPISFLCKMSKVSRSGYYEWLGRKESSRVQSDRALIVDIKSIYHESRKTYGSIRICRELKSQGKVVSKNRIASLMQKEGIKSVHKLKFKPSTTDSRHQLAVATNVIHQDFTTTGPNQKWGCDITYIPTKEGWLYLAIVLDFYSRKVVGWSFDDSLHAELCCDALKMASLRRNSPKELIHHSDRGVQYASGMYCKLLKENRFIQSMSRKGNCYDNAITESWFHTYKVECVQQNKYQTKEHARLSGIDYIENFYNIKRRHSSLDYLSPIDYENNYRLKA